MGYDSSILRGAEVTPGPADVDDSHAWPSSWWDTTRAEVADRLRYRAVLAAEEPDAEVLGLLADQVEQAGVRDLTLPRMPGRDPATALLTEAAGAGGAR
jgi:hypothetical protein